jgi:hypothetical protein
MALPSVFLPEVANELIARIHLLQPNTSPLWGKMNASQMLAHCNITYEYIFDDKHPKPNFFTGWMLKLFVKELVVNEKPYPHNSRTAKDFLITRSVDFSTEKLRLIAYIERVVELGKLHFDGLESHSFGKLNATEWNNMLYKHLHHHLSQFGV